MEGVAIGAVKAAEVEEKLIEEDTAAMVNSFAVSLLQFPLWLQVQRRQGEPSVECERAEFERVIAPA